MLWNCSFIVGKTKQNKKKHSLPPTHTQSRKQRETRKELCLSSHINVTGIICHISPNKQLWFRVYQEKKEVTISLQQISHREYV